MQKTLTLLFLILTIGLGAQTIKLNWKGLEKVDFDGNKLNLPKFANEGFDLGRNKVPTYTLIEKTNTAGNISLGNFQFRRMSASELGDLDIESIPEEISYQAGIHKGGNQWYKSIEIVPFRRTANGVEQLTSFSVNTTNSRTSINPITEVIDDRRISPLNSGRWHKIAVDTTGIYRLDFSFFTENGIPTNFNPRQLKIFGNGGRMLNENPGDFRYGALQENAIRVVGEEDGSFDPGDYVLFYAQGPHDWLRQNSVNQTRHRFNIYEDVANYFITTEGGQGKRISDFQTNSTPTQIFDDYHHLEFHEIDSVNLNNLGRQWAGESFFNSPNRTFSFPLNQPVGELFLRYNFIIQNYDLVNVQLNANGNSIANFTAPICTGNNCGDIRAFFTRQGTTTFSASGNDLNLNISVDNSSNPSASVYLDYLELIYLGRLTNSQGQTTFRRLENINDNQLKGFRVAGAEEVWDVSDITNARRLIPNGGVYPYQSGSSIFQNEFIAFNLDAALTEIEFVETVPNQNIRGFTGVNYAIVSHPNFRSEAERLANYHRDQNGVNVQVVTTEEVYNDFSSGQQDAMAIRDFFMHLRNNGNPLENALLFGGASYDYKDRINNNTNFVPSFQSLNSRSLEGSFVTDDIYTMLDESDNVYAANSFVFIGNHTQSDIGIGRILANTASEARLLVDKTLAFYNQNIPNIGSSLGDWRTRVAIAVDDDETGDSNTIDPDPCVGSNAFHCRVERETANFLETNYPFYSIRKLYTDAFTRESTAGGLRFPSVNSSIINSMDLGVVLMLYFGHGGPRGWAQERIIVNEDAVNLSNYNAIFARLPLVMTVTCDYTVWDVPNLSSGGELMLKNTRGGSVAMLTTSRAIGTSFGEGFTEPVVEQLFTPVGTNYQSLGQAVREAKAINPFNTNNKYRVNLLGDPLLSLPRPQRQIRVNTINGIASDTFDGTLRALDFVTITGEVLDASASQVDVSFNGEVTASLFDKPLQRTTLGQTADLTVMPFEEQITPIYRGKTSVENGEFTLQFYVPKDINFNVGNGKLTLYADNDVIDAIYSNDEISVGDLNPDGLDDNTGPNIGLFMNNLNFVNGGITDRNPFLLACLTDDTGINSSGAGIGHDITAVLDGDIEGTIVLNEYFEGGENTPCINNDFEDYQKGRVLFRFNDLEVGEHTVDFRVWDINNNSSSESLDFVVLENDAGSLEIKRLLNWPNPFTDQTYFQFEHNCASSLDVLVQIFTVSGKLVKTIQQTVDSVPALEGFRTGRFAIPWDGLDDFGNAIGRGVYIYKTSVRSTDQALCPGIASDTEKLVILK